MSAVILVSWTCIFAKISLKMVWIDSLSLILSYDLVPSTMICQNQALIPISFNIDKITNKLAKEDQWAWSPKMRRIDHKLWPKGKTEKKRKRKMNWIVFCNCYSWMNCFCNIVYFYKEIKEFSTEMKFRALINRA